MQRISVLDTTLRDGSQREGISFSVADKLRIARKLDELGVAYIEGGWPGSNPKDEEFFRRAQDLQLANARVAAFGSTRRAGLPVEQDANVRALAEAGVPVAVIVGKSSAMHVREVLRTTPEENVAGRIVGEVCRALPGAEIGMHAHNDNGMAEANTLVAVEAGARHVQGTINGYGERCGNADLCTVIANLALKMGYQALADGNLPLLSDVAYFVAEVANLRPDDYAPYVGRSAFAHKAGLHVNALRKTEASYQHVDPALVGNQMRVLVSELSGRGNVEAKLGELGLRSLLSEEDISALTLQLKERESEGFQYEGAEGSFELLVRRSLPGYRPPFEVLDFLVLVEQRRGIDMLAEATVKARVQDRVMHTAAEGDGPVHALDRAMRKALLPFYPSLEPVHLKDYKVRILDEQAATAARTRVLIDASDGERSWTTVGCSVNIIEASFQALLDSLELPLLGRPSPA